ncbi:MAG: hypothetical protein F4Y98_01530 [Chloroflexi bacterium]|nr:hypothetical protein [Chloroflexota bacterium]
MVGQDVPLEPEGFALKRNQRPFESEEELDAFFRECDAIAGPDREPDWGEHLAVINESRTYGLPRT